MSGNKNNEEENTNLNEEDHSNKRINQIEKNDEDQEDNAFEDDEENKEYEVEDTIIEGDKLDWGELQLGKELNNNFKDFADMFNEDQGKLKELSNLIDKYKDEEGHFSNPSGILKCLKFSSSQKINLNLADFSNIKELQKIDDDIENVQVNEEEIKLWKEQWKDKEETEIIANEAKTFWDKENPNDNEKLIFNLIKRIKIGEKRIDSIKDICLSKMLSDRRAEYNLGEIISSVQFNTKHLKNFCNSAAIDKANIKWNINSNCIETYGVKNKGYLRYIKEINLIVPVEFTESIRMNYTNMTLEEDKKNYLWKFKITPKESKGKKERFYFLCGMCFMMEHQRGSCPALERLFNFFEEAHSNPKFNPSELSNVCVLCLEKHNSDINDCKSIERFKWINAMLRPWGLNINVRLFIKNAPNCFKCIKSMMKEKLESKKKYDLKNDIVIEMDKKKVTNKNFIYYPKYRMEPRKKSNYFYSLNRPKAWKNNLNKSSNYNTYFNGINNKYRRERTNNYFQGKNFIDKRNYINHKGRRSLSKNFQRGRGKVRGRGRRK